MNFYTNIGMVASFTLPTSFFFSNLNPVKFKMYFFPAEDQMISLFISHRNA